MAPVNLLAELIHQVAAAHAELTLQHLSRGGIPEARLPLIRTLAHVDPQTGSRINRLAERTGVSKQAAGQFVAELVRMGWVRIEPDPTDGRARRVCLTASGSRQASAIARVWRDIETTLQDVLGLPRLDQLRSSLADSIAALRPDDRSVREGWLDRSSVSARSREEPPSQRDRSEATRRLARENAAPLTRDTAASREIQTDRRPEAPPRPMHRPPSSHDMEID